jgi:hypothetical protein
MTTATDTLKPNPPSDEDKGENKFDLDKVNVDELPSEIQEQVKRFQADYTKKTQSLKEKEKENEEKIKRGEQWDNWYDRNKDTLEDYNKYAQKIASGENVHIDNRADNTVIDDDDDLDPDTGVETVNVKAIKQDLEKGKQELKREIAVGQEVLLDLMEEIQVGDYPFKVNPKKVIEYAKKEGVGDVKKAIRGAYQKELIDHEVKTRVEEEVAKEKEKLKINVVNDSQPQGRIVRKVVKRGATKQD